MQPTSESFDDDYDAIFVGSGIGGLSGATIAASRGLKVVVLEKTPYIGGVTATSGGQLWSAGSSLQKELGQKDNVEDGVQYILEMSQGHGNEAMARHFLSSTNDAIDFFMARGVTFRVMTHLPDYFYPTMPHALHDGRYFDVAPFRLTSLEKWQDKMRMDRSKTPEKTVVSGLSGRVDDDKGPGMLLTGEALAAHFFKVALDAGVEFRVESPVVGLVKGADGRSVAGVEIQTSTGKQKLRARKGVLLAVGSYDCNQELLDRYEGRLEPSNTLGPPGITGDHLMMGADLGAVINTIPTSRTGTSTGMPTGKLDPYGRPEISVYWSMGPHEIIVNANGQRFADETFHAEIHNAILNMDPKKHTLSNWPAFLIVDEDYFESPVRKVLPGPPLESCIKGDSLQELAAKAGINGPNLQKSIARYNDLCAGGRDLDFGRGERAWVAACLNFAPVGAPVMGPIARAPFYAIKMGLAHVGSQSAGLEINRNSQVMRFDRRPIEGLYAAGNSVGRADLGTGTQSGVANSRGMAYGYVAGKHMSRSPTSRL